MNPRDRTRARRDVRGRWSGLALVAAALVLLAGCAMAPRTIARDRFELTAAISESWKHQMLLNMVKVRYGDAPVFLDVASVITQYALETEVNVTASWMAPLNINANTLGVGGSGRYADRPTITYAPMTGENFARRLMRHIPISSFLSMIQTGYPIDLVFRLCVHSINGIQNSFGGSARARDASPEFFPLLERMRRVQSSGAIGMKLTKVDKDESVTLFFRVKADRETLGDIAAIRHVLGLDPQAEEFRVVYGTLSASDKEIAILTRSMFEILVDLASYIQVPEVHATEKRASPGPMDTGDPLIRVRSSFESPADAFVSVAYQGYWFWIDNRDLPSKRLFSSLMLLFTLVETGGKEGVPIVTIPAGG